jgi:hypothetical protein
MGRARQWKQTFPDAVRKSLRGRQSRVAADPDQIEELMRLSKSRAASSVFQQL